MLSSKRPLFNRKYLIALVWILPLVVLFLNSDYFTQRPYDRLEELNANIVWLPTKRSGWSHAALFLDVGSGLEGVSQANQGFILSALNAQLEGSALRDLIEEHAIEVDLSSTRSYIKLSLQTEAKLSTWLSVFVGELLEIPIIDWNELRSEAIAQAHVQSAGSAQQRFKAALNPPQPSLSANYYHQVISNAKLVLESKDRPEIADLLANTKQLELARSPLPSGTVKLNARRGTSKELRVWAFPDIDDLETYLTQQLIGELVSERLSNSPNTRWVQQLSSSGGHAVLETPLNRGEAVHRAVFSNDLNRQEIERAAERFFLRWSDFTERTALDWPGILLIHQLSFESTEQVIARLKDDNYREIEALWSRLSKPALRVVQQKSLNQN